MSKQSTTAEVTRVKVDRVFDAQTGQFRRFEFDGKPLTDKEVESLGLSAPGPLNFLIPETVVILKSGRG